MSRSLPEKPSLEFLKKEAKELRRQTGGKLTDAQHALAREYGFVNWAALKTQVEGLTQSPAEALESAVRDSDAARVRDLLKRHPELRGAIDKPLPHYGFGATALFAATQRSDRATIEALLSSGADISKRTEWWAGGFGVLDECSYEMADFLIERGAKLDAHSAARLGRLDDLQQFVAADPAVVHARGGDGQTPLHFAANVEIAAFLLEHGAEIDAIDVDHESTAAQYMLRVTQPRHYPRDRQDVARLLVARGCRTDLLMAAALGDAALVHRHLDADPGRIRMNVSEKWFPKRNWHAGGTIYIWTLGHRRTAHTVARDFGHEEIFRLLLERTPLDLKVSLACELGDEGALQEYLAEMPGIPESDYRKLPDAAQNNNTPAVRLMLMAGWPVDARGDSGATALHWAAFHGNAAMIREILRYHPPLEMKSLEYQGSALSWAIFGSGNGWNRDKGDYVGAVEALLEAGAAAPADPERLEPSEAVLEIFEQRKRSI